MSKSRPEKLKMKSDDISSKNIEKIAELFPNAVTEIEDENGVLCKGIDFDILRQELSGEAVEGREERYEFTWVGKRQSMVEANTPVNKTLRPCMDESSDWENTKNIYIEGDNLDALKLLQESYLNKVKMIYIDPPYNTGNDFIYNDSFVMDADEYEEESGIVDEYGNCMIKNSRDRGRYHSNWCSMMFSRLKLAHNLLKDDGVIFISIDDEEQINLKKICDEIFGEENFINTISINMKNVAGASGGGEDKKLKKNIEFLYIYTKNYGNFSSFENVYDYIPIDELIESYKQEKKSWKYTTALCYEGDKKYVGSTVDGDNNEIKIFERNNPVIKSINQLINDEGLSEREIYKKYSNKIFQTAMPQSSIRPRVMEKIKDIGISKDKFYSIEYVPKTGKNKGKIYEQFYKGDNFRLLAWLKDVSEEINGILYKKELQGTYWDFASETKNLSKEGNIPFPNGKKPLKMLIRLLTMQIENNYIVLDFFSGSATTAHAIMQLNTEDSGNRRYIMVQYPERLDGNKKREKENKDLIAICDELKIPKTISNLGKERIRRAGQKIKEEIEEENKQAKLGGDAKKVPDIGFRVFKIDDSNMKDVYYSAGEYSQETIEGLIDNVKEGRTDLDLLYQVLVDWSLPLDLKHEIEKIDGFNVHIVDTDALVACFESNIPESVMRKIAEKKPLRAVFRDGSFKSSPQKLNIEGIFKTIAPETKLRVI